MKRFLLLLAVLIVSAVGTSYRVAAESIKIAPLKYETSIAEGESKKGFVDISNPEHIAVRVKLEAQAFRQVDDDGTLEFYDDSQIKAGVQLDFEQVTLKPRQAMRVYFVLNGNKLPSGDVFAAIFASTVPALESGSRQSARVGTLIIATNGTPPAHTADITNIGASWLQVGEGLSATITVRNPEDEKTRTGFFPDIQIKAQPYSATTARGPLLFAGRSRSVDYRQAGDYFGPVLITANVNGVGKSRLIFAVTGYWRWLSPVLLIAIVGVGAYLLRRRAKFNYRRSRNRR